MKKILIGLIRLYQKIPGNFHYSCKHIPTCSEYTIQAINEYGSIKGSCLGIKRIIKCNPFSKGGIDLVPQRSEKNEKNN